MTVLDEAVTVVDEPKVQLRVRGLSVGQKGPQLDARLQGQPQ